MNISEISKISVVRLGTRSQPANLSWKELDAGLNVLNQSSAKSWGGRNSLPNEESLLSKKVVLNELPKNSALNYWFFGYILVLV